MTETASARVAAVLRQFDLEDRLVTPGGRILSAVRTAKGLGVSLDQIAKTVVCVADSEPVLVVVRGGDRVEIDRVRVMLRVESVCPALAKDVTALTGFPVDGVSPIGSVPPTRVLIDRRLDAGNDLYVSAGNNRSVFRVSFQELMQVVGTAGVLF